MAEMRCCCGNLLESGTACKITKSPCACERPGPGRRQISAGIPSHVFAKQYEERRRAGLPLETDIERAVRSRWS